MSAADERTPQERIQAFVVAVEEELVRPARRYLRGFRRGIVLGLALGILLAPRPGSDSRKAARRVWQVVARRRAHAGDPV